MKRHNRYSPGNIAKIAPKFQKALLNWFALYQRPFPWRSGYQPYQVWISEVMGQQTQMDRVVVYFNNWIKSFPDIQAVAAAPEQKILKAWEGLGYYSRARNIHKTAAILVKEYGGTIPGEYKALLALPGIGPYTAAAIMSIAFKQPLTVRDANVERLFCRLADIDQPIKEKQSQRLMQQMGEQLLARENPRSFNQALMELGALVCTPGRPDCGSCPVRDWCLALRFDSVDLRPVPTQTKKKIDIVMACGIICDSGQMYIQQRLPDDVWGCLWEFPGGRLEPGEAPEQAAVREIMEETEFQVTDLEPFATVVHYYTRYRVTLHSFTCGLQTAINKTPVLHAASEFRWVTRSELNQFAFPSGHRKLLEKMKQDGFFPPGTTT